MVVAPQERLAFSQGDGLDLQESAAADEVAELRTTLEAVQSELASMKARQAAGHAVDFNDYAYRPRRRDWSDAPIGRRLQALLEAGKPDYLQFMEQVCALDPYFRAIPVVREAKAGPSPTWENWWLPGLDACLLYSLIALRKPRTYLEVGSGNSTRFVRKAIVDFGLSTRIVSIDPHPTSDIDQLCDEVIRARCEDAPLSYFRELQAGDMLFIDDSHRSFQNSDVTVCFTEIIPGLAPGVIYGLHDIFLPGDYPADWETRFYNEQYLLAMYLLGGADGDEVLLPGHYIFQDPAFAHLRNRLFLGSRHIDWLTSSFWMIRAGRSD